ncbi:MAG: hypothetical protein QOF76_3765 [Solirubrobacteraceae bacterium]|nr:hypothetical protein [Solirubrobacteraceae bacterium]
MTFANLRRTLAGSLFALTTVVAFLAFVPRAESGALAQAAYAVGLVAVLAAGLLFFVHLTIAVTHPEITRISHLPPARAGESPLFGVVHAVLDALPLPLRQPVEQGRVLVRISSSSTATAYATLSRARRSEHPCLVIYRKPLQHTLTASYDEAYDGLAATIRNVLAHNLALDEMGLSARP